MTADGSGVWVYAVTAEADLDLRGTTGLADRPVRSVTGSGLAAVVSSVDLAEYGEEPLRDKLEDLAALESIARAHHDVVASAWVQAPVVPMRLATVYRDDARVATMLTERQTDLATALERLAGHSEWGVKAYAVAAAPGGARPPGPAGESSRPGTDYLKRRRAEMSSAEESRRAALDASETVHAELSGMADATRRHVPQDARLTGEADPMLLNGAYLVPDDRAEAFGRAVRALDDLHAAVRLELTGPWPGYSFAGDGEAER